MTYEVQPGGVETSNSAGADKDDMNRPIVSTLRQSKYRTSNRAKLRGLWNLTGPGPCRLSEIDACLCVGAKFEDGTTKIERR